MTDKQKEDLAAGGGLIIMLLALAWVFWHLFGGSGGVGPQIGGTTINNAGSGDGGYTGGNVYLSPYAPATGGGDCCCGGGSGCPANANTVQSLNQMIAAANAANYQIVASGNAALYAMAEYANENDPLLNVTVG